MKEEGPQKIEEGEKIKCECITCGKDVEVTLFTSYGYSPIATCPLCNGLAYNDSKKKLFYDGDKDKGDKGDKAKGVSA